MATRQQLLDLCRDILAPLIQADQGELFVVDASDDSLALHLGGTCSGCPGASSTIKTIIEPAVRTLPGAVRLKVTVGAKVPAGASPIERVLPIPPAADPDADTADAAQGAEPTTIA